MADLQLNPEQQAEAQRLFAQLQTAFLAEAQHLAQLMASKPDEQLLGATEFQVRDRILRLGAQVLQAALAERKKGATKGAVPPVPPATRRPSASAGVPRRS